ARINALLGWKSSLLTKFLELADEIDRLVKNFNKTKKEVKKIREETQELIDELNELKVEVLVFLSTIDQYVISLKDFQFREIRTYLNPIIANLKEVIKIKALLDELSFLAND